jgi:hypothetical protein
MISSSCRPEISVAFFFRLTHLQAVVPMAPDCRPDKGPSTNPMASGYGC